MNNFKLGKLPAVVDKRTIKLKSILKESLLPPLPESFNIDTSLGGINDSRMYANDKYGCCVISARAHQTMRFEKFEQNRLINIKDYEVTSQYFKETGGLDSGLVLLYSLRRWRAEGWEADGKNHKIHAFSSVDWKDHTEVKYCIYLLGGINYGFMVPRSAMEQFNNNEPWSIVTPDGGITGGHAVYAYSYLDGYNDIGPVCMTWGKRQQMTWAFWDKYTDEAYAIIDDKNEWQENSPLDIPTLEKYLDEICEQKESDCPFAKAYVAIGNWVAKLFHRKTRIKVIKD